MLEGFGLIMRIMGSICLVGGMALGGILTADRFRGRLEEMSGISRIFLMLRGEVEYHGLVLPEAIRSVGERMEGSLQELLMEIAGKMEDGSGQTFGVIWRSELNDYFAYSNLNKEGERMEGSLQELLMEIAGKMEDGSGQTFGVIWRSELNDYFAYSNLNKEDKKLLLSMGNHLGYLDKRMQTASIDLFLEEWKTEMEDSRKRLPGQCRIASCLGIVSGLLLAVIMI